MKLALYYCNKRKNIERVKKKNIIFIKAPNNTQLSQDYKKQRKRKKQVKTLF